MARPPVLILDPDAERRRQLSFGLTAEGYEVVPTVGLDEARRFAEQLGTAVVVIPFEQATADDGAALDALVPDGSGRRAVVLGRHAEDEMQLPKRALFLAVAHLEADEVARRIRLVLLGTELGLEADAELRSLLGDASLVPLLELLRGLARARVGGRVELEGGVIHLRDGEVVAARTGRVTGLKAFCRLGRVGEGPLRVRLGEPPAERQIHDDLDTLIFSAIEDSLGELPDPRVRLRIEMGSNFFAVQFTPLQQKVMGLIHQGADLRRVLDEIPATDGEILAELSRLEERGVVEREEPRVAVRVVTDSTADLPAALARAHGIEVVPLTVHFGERAFRDGVDLAPRQFYQLLSRKSDSPRSSPPSVDDFATRYREWLAQGDVVSIHLSSKLSETLAHARAAAAAECAGVPGERRLEVVDSRQVSLGLGLLALFAARMATRGEPAEGIGRRLTEMAGRVHTLFGVDTLEYLARGGRIGRARALVGGLLGIRPILALADGEVTALDRVRGGRAVQPRILELLGERVDAGRPLVASIVHANAAAWADRLRTLLRERFQVSELILAEVGPVVGTHAGPGTVGLAVFQPTAEEAALIAPLDAAWQPAYPSGV